MGSPKPATLAIEIVNGTWQGYGSRSNDLKVIYGLDHDGQMVDVLWEDRQVRIFAVDLITRGTEIPDRSVKLRWAFPDR